MAPFLRGVLSRLPSRIYIVSKMVFALLIGYIFYNVWRALGVTDPFVLSYVWLSESMRGLLRNTAWRIEKEYLEGTVDSRFLVPMDIGINYYFEQLGEGLVYYLQGS